MLTCQRHLFSLPDDLHYLNCSYMGPLARSTEEAGVAGVRKKSVPSAISPASFFEEPWTLRQAFAKLVNSQPERVALVPSVSYGVAIATHNQPLGKGRNVVVPGEDFPSNVYGWMDNCRRDGAELRMVPRPADVQKTGEAWTQRVLEAIDDQTAVVTLTAVHWTDGTPFDLEAIGQRAREVGALYLVDGTQSVGAMPFDFARVQPDLLVCASYKWLLGPYQLGLAVLGDRLLEGQPIEKTWIGRKGSEDFAGLVDYTNGYQPGARRFDAGEHSNPVTVPMLIESLRQIDAWGVPNIAAYIAGLGNVLAEALGTDKGFMLAPAPERAPHMLGVRLPDAGAIPAILEELARRKIYVSQRGSSIRVSPHVYNTEDDVAALADALRAAVR